jgi:hypothetical protein
LRLRARAESARGNRAKTNPQSAIHNPQFVVVILRLLLCVAALLVALPAPAQVELPEFQSDQPIVISAAGANHWREGAYEVWLLEGGCRIDQGAGSARGRQAVLWIDHAGPLERRPSRVIAYLEGDVAVESDGRRGAPRLTDQTWIGRLHTERAVEVHAARIVAEPLLRSPVYQRGLVVFEPGPAYSVRQAQFVQQTPSAATAAAPAPAATPASEPPPPGTRRLRAFPRGNVGGQAEWFQDPHSNQWVAVIDSGVNLIVDGLKGFGSIDLAADRLVLWTRGVQEPDLNGQVAQDEKVPLEIYLEGNIVFRQGDRVIYANRMYYDVANHVGTMLGAEMLTPVRKYEGLLRLHADVIQQTGRDHYFAHNAFVTSSRMGAPGYRLQSGDVELEDIQSPLVEPWTGQPVINPETGEPVIEHQRLATAGNNFLYAGPVPIFYWPVITTNLSEPTYYIRRIQFKNDQVFGTQVLTDWNVYELLGIRQRPAGTDWGLSIDYLSKRGLGHGTVFTHHRDQFLGIAGPTNGLIDFWGIKDNGFDNLGSDRSHLQPEKDYRFRLLGQHRQQLPGDFQLTAEVGWQSDRNFLAEYYQQEWNELKDQTTGLELKHTRNNVSWSISADVRLNEFYTQTEWLPRGDHFWLGQPLLHDTFTWYEHSSAAYARFRQASAPSNPQDQPFSYLAWESSSRAGERLATRQEIDWPLQVGPVKVVPYALGELARWGQDLNGQPLDRIYGQAGVRASMPMWAVNPAAESGLWNVHGLAHKVVFDAEFSIADSKGSLDQLPLYDPLDDDDIEAFRRRLAINTFGVSPVPKPFDERFYALRTGMASWVTAPSTEIADDLTAVRLGMHNRWQTKRGMPDNRRIIDWIILDTNVTLFPAPSRDDFGKTVGLLDYDFRWHVGDRLTLVSDGIFDFFPSGQQLVTIGGFLTRPPRGSLYLGLRLLEGPINNQVLSMSYSYWMSPKWVSSFGMSVDLGRDGNIGQNLNVTRIGESLLVSAGFTVDAARNNVGVNFTVEPRFLPKNRLGSIGGVRIPPAGAYGLE